MFVRRWIAALACLGFVNAASAVPVGLGSFSFDSNAFGDTLDESDGGVYSSMAWLNVLAADPGNPGYLTGASFDTGIANIFDPSLAYTIGYSTGIVNGTGDDLGVIVARYSSDSFVMAVSSDGGATFSADLPIAAASGVSSGVDRTYFYAVNGQFTATLFVHSLDLGTFGVAANASIDAVRIRGAGPELDLIRVAGFASGNGPPDCSGAVASAPELWPPNHDLRVVSVLGVVEPDGDPLTIRITSILQDEPVDDLGDGATSPDATGVGGNTALVRAERTGIRGLPGDGRVYHVDFRAEDAEGGTCTGEVIVCVPHDQRPGRRCVDQGARFDSTAP